MLELEVGTSQESIFLDLQKQKINFVTKRVVTGFLGFFEQAITPRGLRTTKITFGPYAIGDQFVTSETRKAELSKLGSYAVDMKAGAVCLVTSRLGIECIVIKAIFDTAGEGAVSDYSEIVDSVSEK